MSLLLIDNYDSFTFNLYQLFAGLGAEVVVRRNDAIGVDEALALGPSHVVLSPGPGHPARARDFGVCGELIDRLAVPTLGVCLGHQGIAHRLGGTIVRAPEIIHGKVSPIRHCGTGLFRGLSPELEVMRYHSLVVERASLPAELEVTAETHDGLVMAMAHRERPLFGLQFHPESFATPDGGMMLRNFLASRGADR